MTLLLAGCDGPLSTLAPAGPAAGDIALLWWGMLIGSAAITLLVGVLLALSFGPPRVRPVRYWTHGWGLGFSLAVLTTVLVAGLWIGERILPRDDGAVEVRAHAYQWGWRFAQPNAEGETVQTDGVLYIPAGRPVDVIVTAEDVIHAFWVPQLAGKVDAIPGRRNLLRIEADRPGTHDGLCAEFCGLGHATMRFELVAYGVDAPPDALADAPAAEEYADD